MSTKSDRILILLAVAVLLVVHPETGASGQQAPLAPGTESVYQPVELRTIVFPVVGPSNYSDTYGACRDGCSRLHQGVDIFAPKLTPLVAAVDGTIVAERRNATNKPGNKVVIEDAEGWRYSYFHLNNDSPGTDNDANPQSWIMAPGLRAGDAVRAGDLVGYLGDSGNAEETPPHLHFEIKPPGRPPINPTASVTAARGRNAVVSEVDFRATDAEGSEWFGVVEDRYAALLGRSPTDTELVEWASRLALGHATEADLVGDLAMAAPHREPEGTALRAYISTFSRLPTESILDRLVDLYRDGGSLDTLAGRIVGSVVYQTLDGTSTAEEIVALSGSDDVKLDTWHLVQVVRAYRAAAGRLPDSDELEGWTAYLDAGGLLVDVVAAVLEGDGPGAEPRHAGVFAANDLGFRPGLSVRQGPIDLDPAADGAYDPGLDYELVVEEGDDGSDTANLVVRIPLDELAAAANGDAELTVELRLTPSDDDEDAEATVDLAITDAAGSASVEDPRTSPTVRTPTTRPPTTRPPTTRPPATRPPATRSPTTQPPTSTTTTTTTSDGAGTTTAASSAEATTTTASSDEATTTASSGDAATATTAASSTSTAAAAAGPECSTTTTDTEQASSAGDATEPGPTATDPGPTEAATGNETTTGSTTTDPGSSESARNNETTTGSATTGSTTATTGSTTTGSGADEAAPTSPEGPTEPCPSTTTTGDGELPTQTTEADAGTETSSTTTGP